MHSAHDIIGKATAKALCTAGIDATYRDLWPEPFARLMRQVRIPFSRTFYKFVLARGRLSRLNASIHPSDILWIFGPALPHDLLCSFERKQIGKGAHYVFHLMDDWFSVPGMKEIAEARVPLASLVVVPTEPLAARVRSLFPDATVAVLEEPIDVQRLAPPATQANGAPRIVWCGNPYNQKELPSLKEPLERVYREIRFEFTIISATRPRHLDLNLPWKWCRYDRASEGEMLGGSVAGLAPVEDTPYARCKGSYKVKTYLAAGVPPIGSPVGHQSTMIRHGENGFFASTADEWMEALLQLLRNPELARKMGVQARRDACEKYAYDAVVPTWAGTLKKHFHPIEQSSQVNEQKAFPQ